MLGLKLFYLPALLSYSINLTSLCPQPHATPPLVTQRPKRPDDPEGHGKASGAITLTEVDSTTLIYISLIVLFNQ